MRKKFSFGLLVTSLFSSLEKRREFPPFRLAMPIDFRKNASGLAAVHAFAKPKERRAAYPNSTADHLINPDSSIGSAPISHLESIGPQQRTFITIGGPQAHGNSKAFDEQLT